MTSGTSLNAGEPQAFASRLYQHSGDLRPPLVGLRARLDNILAMLDLAVQGNPRLGVERIELDLPTPSYTVRTLRALAERQAAIGNRFMLLLGADAAQDLAAWWEVEALPGLADIVIFARPGTSVPH